jgi:hypothetical protein
VEEREEREEQHTWYAVCGVVLCVLIEVLLSCFLSFFLSFFLSCFLFSCGRRTNCRAAACV